MRNKSLFKNLTSWGDFQKTLDDFSKKEKGDAFEMLTKLYFKINPIYNFYDDVWLLSEVPQKVLDYLELPSHDLGIDLIAKANNEYHAIQCKYHTDKNTSVTFKEVSTFISLLESNEKFTQGYICSSADLTSRNFNKLKTKPINSIMSDSWQVLDADFFNQARKLLIGNKLSIKPYKPREHQDKAVSQSIEYFIDNDNTRGKLIFPCGSGKSLTGYWITQELKSKSTIIAVPSLSLVKQTLEVYLREIVAHGRKVKWLCICSDEGIGKNDDVVIYTENIGVPCQTDPVYIEDWLKENKDEDKIVFTTYQSGRIISEISKRLNFTFDLGIFDEAHKTVGSNKKLFSHLLFDENISIDKRVFMTATERFYGGSKDDIVSMDDYDIYGETFSYMSFKEAIGQGLLTDYKVITIDVKKSEVAEFIKKNGLVELNKNWSRETDARSLASMIALRKAMKLFPINNAVSFHSSIEKAKRNKELQQYITKEYKLPHIESYTVSGKIPTTRRNDIVMEFANSEKALITNARCLTEGIDVPNIDCIVFADPRRSNVDIVQSLGRALRTKSGKDWGYVILPIIIDETTKEIDNSNFQDIVTVIRGLASNDDRIVEYFKEKSTNHKLTDNKQSGFTFDVLSEYLDDDEIKNHLNLRLWEKLGKLNWMDFDEARGIVHKLLLKNYSEWRDYCKSGKKPINIPISPRSAYQNQGWAGYGDWLGTGVIARKDILFRSYDKAKKYVHKLKLKNSSEWRKYSKSLEKPHDIPASPEKVYKNSGWNGFGEWLGTGRLSSKDISYRNFKYARKFVHNLLLKNTNEWKEYCNSEKKPEDIPAYPNQTYKDNGWKSMGDWLGTGSVASQYYTYKDFVSARRFIRKLELKNINEWREYCKSGNKPINIPVAANKTYKNEGWKGWGDFLGNGNISNRDKTFVTYEKAKLIVKPLQIKSYKEWRNYIKQNGMIKGIPASPYRTYKQNGWKGWGDFLGTNRLNVDSFYEQLWSYDEAKAYLTSKGIQSQSEFNKFKKTNEFPNEIPRNPALVYGRLNTWSDWGDFLSTGFIATRRRKFMSFEDSVKWARELNFTTRAQWTKYKKTHRIPDNIPRLPEKTYANDGWKGYPHWLGYKPKVKVQIVKKYSYYRNIARKLGLKSRAEWHKAWKDGNLPPEVNLAQPDKAFKEEWISWGDWLGTGFIHSSKRQYLNYEDAHDFVKTLGLKTWIEWKEYCKSGKKPDDIPSNPQRYYKDKGWNGIQDFLGNSNK
ncbi:MAG: DEAD/DEAH box helicase family protein [Lentimicrobiaceae bacterium]|nr:DEAD/DEAH box helicase family protein [Lentimicrobiaceae bacterium]